MLPRYKMLKRNFEIVSNRIIIISVSNLFTKFINSTTSYTGKFPNKRFNIAKNTRAMPIQENNKKIPNSKPNEKKKIRNVLETFDLGPPTLILHPYHQRNRIVLTNHAI